MSQRGPSDIVKISVWKKLKMKLKKKLHPNGVKIKYRVLKLQY
jgi:hypothetical protein